MFTAREEVPGIVWNTNVEGYFDTNQYWIPRPKVARNISEQMKVKIYSLAFDGLVAGVEENLINLKGKSDKELKICLADNLTKPEKGDMVRLFATPLSDGFSSPNAFGFYLRNYSLENEVSGLNSENLVFQEELIHTRFPGLDDKLMYESGEDTIRDSTKRVIEMLKGIREKDSNKFKPQIFRSSHKIIFQEVEDACYEGLVKISYNPNSPADSRNYAMRLVSVEDVSILGHLQKRGGSLEEIFIPEEKGKFKVLGRITKGKEAINRITRLNDSIPSFKVSEDKLDKFFYMCKKAREGKVSSDNIVKMLKFPQEICLL